MVTCPTCGQENPDGFRLCGMCGTPLAEARMREERKVVSVLFCDLVGSTAQAERMDPEDVRALLSRYQARVRAKLERFGGTVEKFIGDAVVAFFGAPVTHEDDPERAVRAALAIRDWVGEESDLHVRIAVNTGEALVVVDARPSEGEGMASGDVVNTAARLQAAAPVDGILVGEQTYRATERVIEYRAAVPVVAKGKSKPLAAWEVVDARSRLGVDRAQPSRAPLVGRERELDLLVGALDRASGERSVQLVTLVGVPGIGKSRLLAELFAAVEARERLITWRQGRSLPYGEGVSFWALGEIVKAQAGMLETDVAEEAKRKLEEAVGRVGLEEAEATWISSQLEPLLGLSGDGLAAGSRGESFAAWRRFLEALAEERPLVLVFEDLHWADDALLDFVDELAERLNDVSVLIVATARPELLARRPAWGGGKPNATTVSLTALSDDDTARLVHALLDRAVLPAELRSALLERAGGNPLYAEEFIRMAAERRGSELDVPESVQGIIAARLDALAPEDKDLLANAAVLGKVFWTGALAALGGGDRFEIEERLHGLERRELVRRERRTSVAGESEYAFRHVLVRDVAYGTITRAVRAEKHVLAGAWIESLGRPDEHAELVAHHHSAALEFARAAGTDEHCLVERVVASSRAAGDRAMALGSWAAAAALYGRALELIPATDSRRATLLARVGEARFNADGSGLELLREAIEVLLAAGEAEEAAMTAVFAARAEWHRGDRDEAHAFTRRAVELIEGRRPNRATVRVLGWRAGLHLFEGEYAAGLPLAREAAGIADELGDDILRARVRNTLGGLRTMSGDSGGIADLLMSVHLADQGAGAIAGTALNNLFMAYRLEGRSAEARQALESARANIARFGTPFERAWIRSLDAAVAYASGNWGEALRAAEDVIEGVEAGTSTYMEPVARCVRASIRLARGDLAGAEGDSECGVIAARTGSKDVQMMGPALAARGRVAFAAGRQGEARALADEVARFDPAAALLTEAWSFPEYVALLHDLGMGEELARVLDALPDSWPWTHAGRAVAEGDLVSAADILGSIAEPLAEATFRLKAGEALMRTGRNVEADEQLAQALAFFRSVGATVYISAAEALAASAAS